MPKVYTNPDQYPSYDDILKAVAVIEDNRMVKSDKVLDRWIETTPGATQSHSDSGTETTYYDDGMSGA